MIAIGIALHLWLIVPVLWFTQELNRETTKP